MSATAIPAATDIEVVGIGNAIVDIIAQVDDAFIQSVGLVKGSMTLIDAAQSAAIYDKLPPAIEASGGSAGNTIAGIASLGGRAAYIGKVRDDQLGGVFRHDMRALGVRFEAPSSTTGPATAQSMIMVTEDAQRTMATYLGSCVELTKEELDRDAISHAAVTYMEGYLFDPPLAQEAFYEAARLAHANKRLVSLTLSDSFCVHRHKRAFSDLVDHHIDILFANETELKALTLEDDFRRAVNALRDKVRVAACTRSEKGSVILFDGEVYEIAAEPVTKVVDTTGAGDQYAAGFLFGFVRGFSPADCGRIASIAAAEVISHYGPRPMTPLRDLVAKQMPHLGLLSHV